MSPPDDTPPEREQVRRLAAVWFADIVGYSTLSEQNEDLALETVRAFQEVSRDVAEQWGGRVVKFLGDGVLAEFPSVDGAVRAALALQEGFRPPVPEGPGSALRVGVHLGEVVGTPDGDIYGDGVNVASRLEREAETGQVVVSSSVHEQVRNRPGIEVAAVPGTRRLKGLSRTARIFVVRPEGVGDPDPGGAAEGGDADRKPSTGLASATRPVAIGLTTAVGGFFALIVFVALSDGDVSSLPAELDEPAGEVVSEAAVGRAVNLGVEYFYTGDYASAAEQLRRFLDEPFHSAPPARRALRYLARSELELDRPEGARAALASLLELEPPLVLLIPTVESDTMMDLYYEVRRDRLRDQAVAGGHRPVTGILLFDFRMATPEADALTEQDAEMLGPMVADMVWTDLELQGAHVESIEEMKFGQRGDDAYRDLEEALSAQGEAAPSHALVGALAVRGEEVLLSAWLFELQSGALTLSEQVIGPLSELPALPERLAEGILSELSLPEGG